MRKLLYAFGILSLLILTPAPSHAGVGQILRAEEGLVTVGYYAAPDIEPGSVLSVSKLFREGKVRARAAVVAVDRAASTLRLRFEEKPTREPIAIHDFVQLQVVQSGSIAAPPPPGK